MLVLLPPSEGKSPPADGGPTTDLGILTSPRLTPMRARVLSALVEVSGRPDALELLGVGAGVAADVARNLDLRTAPTAPARHVYSGVLYAAAGFDELGGASLERADEHVRVVSALWGLVAPSDRIPAYRLAMGRDLPGIGSLAAAWREPLSTELDPVAARRLVVDCRSAAYLAAWRPSRDAHGWVTVRVVRGGKVVSHAAKHTRGVLAGHLVRRTARPPRAPEELLEAARELVDLAPAGRGTVAPPRVVGVRLLAGPATSRVLELAVD